MKSMFWPAIRLHRPHGYLSTHGHCALLPRGEPSLEGKELWVGQGRHNQGPIHFPSLSLSAYSIPQPEIVCESGRIPAYLTAFCLALSYPD
jgi:hypothetical protein